MPWHCSSVMKHLRSVRSISCLAKTSRARQQNLYGSSGAKRSTSVRPSCGQTEPSIRHVTGRSAMMKQTSISRNTNGWTVTSPSVSCSRECLASLLYKPMLKPEDCGMCRHFRNGEERDFCSLTGEPRECYEDPCEEGDADAAPNFY